MITGDSRETAMSIAKELTIINENDDPEKCVFTGTQFDKMTDSQKKAAVGGETGKVFSRVEPAHKRELVKHLIDMGQIVAMTGLFQIRTRASLNSRPINFKRSCTSIICRKKKTSKTQIKVKKRENKARNTSTWLTCKILKVQKTG